MASPNKSKGDTSHELAADLAKVRARLMDDEDDKMNHDKAGAIASISNVELRVHLGELEYARSRGEKPDIAFFRPVA